MNHNITNIDLKKKLFEYWQKKKDKGTRLCNVCYNMFYMRTKCLSHEALNKSKQIQSKTVKK